MSDLQLHTSTAHLQLAPNKPLRLTGASGTRLRAVSGVLWVTIDRDLQDHVLQAGDSLVIESSQAVLVTALGRRSTLAVCAPTSPTAGAAATWRQAVAWARRPALRAPAALAA